MDLDERLSVLGLNRARLADRMGVSKAAVSQWKELPEKAEELLKALERDSVGVIPLGALVRCDNGTLGRVVVVERNECLHGSRKYRWVYLVSEAVQEKDGSLDPRGPARRWPEGALEWVQDRVVVWAEKKVNGDAKP